MVVNEACHDDRARVILGVNRTLAFYAIASQRETQPPEGPEQTTNDNARENDK